MKFRMSIGEIKTVNKIGKEKVQIIQFFDKGFNGRLPVAI